MRSRQVTSPVVGLDVESHFLDCAVPVQGGGGVAAAQLHRNEARSAVGLGWQRSVSGRTHRDAAGHTREVGKVKLAQAFAKRPVEYRKSFIKVHPRPACKHLLRAGARISTMSPQVPYQP